MHRLLAFAVVGAVATLPASLQAQRGFGARASVHAAPRLTVSPATRSAPAFRSVPAGTHFVGPGRIGNRGLINPGFRHHHHHHHFFFVTSGCFGNPYCSSFYYPYTYFPYSYLDYPLFGPETEYIQQSSQAQPNYDTALQNQINQLTDEVDRLREEEQERQTQPSPPRTAKPIPQPATTLVFRDGHRAEVQNYAIVGQTLWAFTEHQARKYPLSQLNLPETKAANEQRGIDFAVPSR